MKPQNLKYLGSLDLLRGLAALAVAFFHFTHGNKDYLSHDGILFQIGTVGFLGVEVFFVISGFVIPYSMYRAGYKISQAGRFLGKRVVRIEPPYILSILMVIALNYISTLSPYYRGEPFHLDFTGLALHLGYLNAFFHYNWLNDVYWTLAIEFQYYLIIALSFPLLIHSKKIYSFIFLLIFGVASFFVKEHSLIFSYSLLFIIGIIMFQFYIGYLSSKQFGILMMVLFILLFGMFDQRYVVAALLPFFFVFYIDLDDKLSKFLGKISYSLYLVHIPIGGRVINLIETFTQNELLRSLGVFVAIIVSIFASWIFFKVIEEPAIKWAKRISYKKK